MSMTTRQSLEDAGFVINEVKAADMLTTPDLDHFGNAKKSTVNDHVFIDAPSCGAMAQLNYSRAEDGDMWYFGRHCPDRATTRAAMEMGAAPEPMFDAYCEMRDKLQPLIDKYAGVGTSTKRRRVRREEGSELDIDRVMVGDPTCWETRIRGKKKKLIRLAVQFGYVAGASEATFIRGGAMAAAAADVLGRLGYAVQIDGISWGVKDGTEYVVTVRLKNPNEPLDPRNLLVTGLQGMSRCYEFAIYDAFKGVRSMSMPALTPAAREHAGFTALIGQNFNVSKGAIGYDPVLENFATEMMETI